MQCKKRCLISLVSVQKKNKRKPPLLRGLFTDDRMTGFLLPEIALAFLYRNADFLYSTEKCHWWGDILPVKNAKKEPKTEYLYVENV